MSLAPIDREMTLGRIRDLALALPETIERASHGQPTFFAAGRMFAQFRQDHHGDGRTVVCLKTSAPEEARTLIEADPAHYSPVSYFSRDWIGLMIGEPDTDWDHVGDKIAQSWELSAPRRLLEAGGRRSPVSGTNLPC